MFSWGYDEKYKCSNCNRYFDREDVSITYHWKCPKCGGYIHIAAPELKNGCVMIRKPVSELKKNELVHVAESYIHSIIAIEKKDENKVRIALKGYRTVMWDSRDYVSVVIGGYNKDNWRND